MATRILIVEDDRAIAKLTATWARSAGYEVDIAFDGTTGLAKVRTRPPDAILLDIRLPDIDGIEVCREIKTDPDLADIPIIFLSANVQDSARKEVRMAGGAAFIAKPYEHAHIADALKNALAGRRTTTSRRDTPHPSQHAGDVLIVDDDESILRMLAIFLGSRGYTCRAARSGAQGVLAFDAGDVSLIITDLNMPAGNGVALIERIRRTSDVPIIVATAFPLEYAAQLEDLQHVHILRKPFDSSRLLDLVDACLSGQAVS